MKKEGRDARILAVCGTGNNGGDAVATARILHEQGYKTAITVIGESGRMSDDMNTQLLLASNVGVPVLPSTSITDGVFDVLLDGLFGIGLSRDIISVYETVVDAMNESPARCYAIDIPSGISAETGAVQNAAVKAACTITFGVNKTGLVLYPGCEYAGEVIVADIGFPAASTASVEAKTYFYEQEDLRRLPVRRARSHKGTFGHVLVVAGSESMSGACYLAAKAAYKAGAGLVRVVSTENNRTILLSALPEILFSTREELEEAAEWADAIVIGPGIGLTKEAEDMVQYILETAPVPTVIDGDAIRICSHLAEHLSDNFILTPHVKEMTYLSGKTVQELLDGMLLSTKASAKKWNCTIVHKDAKTVVSNGDETYINVSGNDGMATGGSGDVLAGCIGGFLAQGMEPFEAAKLGVYIHGLAGDVMAEEKGHYSLMASDLTEGISRVLSGFSRFDAVQIEEN
jgi:NAD(P)H-hydrate epimerase